ncbi:unnamed protein product [Closterium sp. Yama58-4]|nr:unnamed protein product [Closterium sp. Yama58-4]
MADVGKNPALDDTGGFLEGLFDTDSDVITRRIPSRNTEYSQPHYWRTRYAGEETILYDWYDVDFETFWRSHIAPLCSIEDRKGRDLQELDNSFQNESHLLVNELSSVPAVSATASTADAASGSAEVESEARAAVVAPLVVVEIGSGNSEWSMRMSERGLHVISTDVDAGVMASMSRLHASHPQFGGHPVDRMVADARCLPFRGVVDIVVDKGTVDALLCQPPSKECKLQPLLREPMKKAASEKQMVMPLQLVLWTEAERSDGVTSLARSVHRSLKPCGAWLLASAKPSAVLLTAIGHQQMSRHSGSASSSLPRADGLGRRFCVDVLSESSNFGVTVLHLTKESDMR